MAHSSLPRSEPFVELVSGVYSQVSFVDSKHSAPHHFGDFLQLVEQINSQTEENDGQLTNSTAAPLKALHGSLKLRPLTELESLETTHISNPFLLAARRIKSGFSAICQRCIASSVFEAVILVIIIANTITLALQTPGTSSVVLEQLELAFLVIYSVEAGLKVSALQRKYFLDSWNLMDFVIVVTGWLEILVNQGLNLSALRALRVLRPLKSISSIEGMRLLFKVLVKSFKPLVSSLLILFFFFLVFAIAGLNIWMGILKYKCMTLETGMFLDQACGYDACSSLAVCVKSLDNPNYGVTNFDNVLFALLQIFQIITLEGWSSIMALLQTTFSYWSFLYFIPLVFAGAFFLMNLAIVVIKIKFTKTIEEAKRQVEHGNELNNDQMYLTPVSMTAEWTVYRLEVKPNIDSESNLNSVKNEETENIAGTRAEFADLARSKSVEALIMSTDTLMLRLTVTEDSLYSDSQLDVVPPDSVVEEVVKDTYEFQYCLPSPPEPANAVQRSAEFNQRVQKEPLKQAYCAVVFGGQETICSVQQQDKRTQNVCGEWSGGDIEACTLLDQPTPQPETLTTDLSHMSYRLWSPNCWSGFEKLRVAVYVLVESKQFNNLMTLCVVLNTIVLALDHHGISAEMEEVLNTFNVVFSVIFAAEMLFKIYGLTLRGYCRDSMNWFDGLVVLLSIAELLFLSGNSTLTAFRTIRIFRTFRILRVARLFRYLEYMSRLIDIIGNSLSISLYLFLLLLVFILIFALLGMQLFGGNFDFPEGTPRANFENFHWAFIAVFQILSTENWNVVLYDGIRASGYASSLFFISWIFIGNFILLNLFLAILLDSFSADEPKVTIMRDPHTTSVQPTVASPVQYAKDSLFLFSQTNSIRLNCRRIITASKFEACVLLVVSLSSIKLVYESYILDYSEDSIYVQVSVFLDYIFTAFFVVEMLMKVVALGFVAEKNTYLRDSWNVLDMVIVVFSVVELAVHSTDIAALKVLRLLRTLRPLRFITHNLSMKIVVNALFNSLKGICNVGVVIVIVAVMFAILGVALFGGKFYSCDAPEIETQEVCEAYGYSWINERVNFDNVIQAMLALFIITSLDDWTGVMNNAVDSTEVGHGPEKNANPLYAYYFVLYIVIVSFFFMNLIIGTIFESYQKAKEKEEQPSNCGIFLTEEQKRWYDVLKLISVSRPQIHVEKLPQSKIGRWFYKICTSTYFEVFILVCIVLNMLQMAIVYEGAPTEYTEGLELINLVLTGVFIAEAVLKICGLGPLGYFRSHWNKFDFFVVLASVLELILKEVSSSNFSILHTGPQLARVFRILRVAKLLRLVRSLKDIQAILETIQYSLAAMFNVVSLLLLLFFIYAVLGVFLFHNITVGDSFTDHSNFLNFANAMLLLLRISTGEDWNAVMYDCAEGNAAAAYLYFTSFQIITGYVMLNLFIMVLLQGLELHYENPNSIVDLYSKKVKKFKEVWKVYSDMYQGAKMHNSLLPDLMYDLGEDLGAPSTHTRMQVIKTISALDLPIDQSGCVHYHDMLFALLKRVFARFRLARANPRQIDILIKQEKLTLRKILNYKKDMNRDGVYGNSRNEFINQANLNPFSVFTTLNKVFKSWHNWAKASRTDRSGQLLDLTYTIIRDTPPNSSYDQADQGSS